MRLGTDDCRPFIPAESSFTFDFIPTDSSLQSDIKELSAGMKSEINKLSVGYEGPAVVSVQPAAAALLLAGKAGPLDVLLKRTSASYTCKV